MSKNPEPEIEKSRYYMQIENLEEQTKIALDEITENAIELIQQMNQSVATQTEAATKTLLQKAESFKPVLEDWKKINLKVQKVIDSLESVVQKVKKTDKKGKHNEEDKKT